MKSSIWIAVSFSVLATASASAAPGKQAKQDCVKAESAKLIKALNITEVPTFRGKPCIASTK